MGSGSNVPSGDSGERPSRVLIVAHYLPYAAGGSPTQDQLAASRPTTSTSSSHATGNHNNHNNQNNHKSDHGTSSGLSGKKKSCDDVLEMRRDHASLFSGVAALGDDTAYIGILSPPHPHRHHHLRAASSSHSSLTEPLASSEGSDATATTTLVSAEPSRDQVMAALKEKRCYPVSVPKTTHADFYEGYCKKVLWPILHYILWEDPLPCHDQAAFWHNYVAVNEAFAETICAVYKANDLVWIHDYHLFLVPSMVRARHADAKIGFFLHTPFPSSEIFRCIPKRKELLDGLLASDHIGFQTKEYMSHFISAATRVLGVESNDQGVNYLHRHVHLSVCPIGMDLQRIRTFLEQRTLYEQIKKLNDMYHDKKIIFGWDKLDPVNGVLHKLHAFELFLRLYPEWRTNAVFIQVSIPTPHRNAKLERRIAETVARINGMYGTLSFSPLHYHSSKISEDQYYGLLHAADVALICPIRDGMNTTSVEFVMCQQSKAKSEPGQLVLSEFTGTATCIPEALINPWDYKGIAATLANVLTLSAEEKCARHKVIYDRICNRTSTDWATHFVQSVLTSTSLVGPTKVHSLGQAAISAKFRQARKRLFFFDYDGTLTPIVSLPTDAVPSHALLDALKVLADDPNNTVFIVSGRDCQFLDTHFGKAMPQLGLSAEHGCLLKRPAASKCIDAQPTTWRDMTKEGGFDLSWKKDVIDIFKYYTERTAGSLIEEKQASVTWHYRNSDTFYGEWQAKECHNHLRSSVTRQGSADILIGKKNIEVRPKAINKGEIVKRLVLEYGQDADFIFCAGDDKTDEDMFCALKTIDQKEAVTTLWIGTDAERRTYADFSLQSPEAMNHLLTSWAMQ